MLAKRGTGGDHRQLLFLSSVVSMILLFPKQQILDFQRGRKDFGKRRNCSLLAFSPFPRVFQKTCTANT